jgi:hypothetical protein
MEGVSALPPVLARIPRCTAVTCPDCAGTLTVQTEGDTGYLHFRCRTGHAFSLTSLLACKEEVLEARLWTALTALEELAALLRDLDRVGEPFRDGCPAPEAHRRIADLDLAMTGLRRILDGNLPLVVGAGDLSE